MTQLEVAQQQIDELLQKNQELADQLSLEEQRNRQLQANLRAGTNQMLNVRIGELRAELAKKDAELRRYQMMAEEKGFKQSTFSSRPENTAQDLSQQSFMSEKDDFYIQEEENVSVKDQQIRELKQTISELNNAYVDYAKYKSFYEAHHREEDPMGEVPVDQRNREIFLEYAKRGEQYFEGAIVGGKRNGFCREVTANGEVFEGHYVNDVREGQGRLENAEMSFQGLFVSGQPKLDQGQIVHKPKMETVQVMPNLRFVGQTIAGVPNGDGYFEFQPGVKLFTNFVAGQIAENNNVKISLPESEEQMNAELFRVPGVDAIIIKSEDNKHRFIWNLATGELKLI